MEPFCLFGPKTSSLLDVWSFEHILSGFSLACLCEAAIAAWLAQIPAALRPRIVMLATLAVSFYWEILEHYLETGLWGDGVTFWLQGVEHWSNRMIADNVMIFFGALGYLRWAPAVLSVRILSLIWLVVHIFILPHSMALQDRFLPWSFGCA